MDLTTTRAIVTGGASGLGAATAQHFRDIGAQVTILDRDPAGEAFAASIGAGFAQTDVTDEDSVAAAVSRAVDQMGGIDACVNCAGIVTGEKTVGRDGPHKLDSFRRTIEINLIGSFNMLRLAAEAMARNEPNEGGERGVIINTASVAAQDGQIGQAAYSASKGGVYAMTLPVARDLMNEGVRVNTILPGIMWTPMMAGMDQKVQDALAAMIPFPKRLGTPADYAALALHLAENTYINGECIRLDGAIRLAPR